MPLAWLNIKTAQSLFRQDPSFEQARTTRPLKMGCCVHNLQAVAYHVVAVSTDRSRYLWSAAPQSLERLVWSGTTRAGKAR